MDNIFLVILIYIVGVCVVLYFTTVIPGKRKNKEMQAMHDSVAVGDQISSIGGIIGTVVERNDETVTILTDSKTGSTITIVVMAVQSILEKASQ